MPFLAAKITQNLEPSIPLYGLGRRHRAGPMGFTRPAPSGTSQIPLRRYGSGKPSWAFSWVAKAKSRAMRSAFVGLFLAAKTVFVLIYTNTQLLIRQTGDVFRQQFFDALALLGRIDFQLRMLVAG